MMVFFKKMSIRNKLITAILLCCTLLLSIVGGCFLTVEFYSSRAALSRELTTLASSLATNSSRSLVLDKYTEIEQTLASLANQKAIHAAYLFDRSGEPVAEYLDPFDSQMVVNAIRSDFAAVDVGALGAAEERRLFDWHHMSLFAPVFFEGETIGFIYLLSDLGTLYTRLEVILSGFLLAFLLLILSAWLLAYWIQKPVLAPLLQLAEVMEEVGADNYSVRAVKVSSDEVGFLVDGFNRMLTQIERQRMRLIRHKDVLEETVALRTSELRDTVEQLDLARQQADAANRAKSDFLSKMTHELRTPLIGVLGMNELLQRTTLDDQQRLLTETVQKSGEDLLGLIGDVLDIARIEAGKLELEPTAVELHKIVEDVARLLAPNAAEKGVELVVDIPASATWQVEADESRVRQIVTNLVGNAIKFTPSGQVAVALDYNAGGQEAGEFVLSVTDTGVGMSEQDKNRVFNLFYQADGASEKNQQGAGLGLAIVSQLVELMQGEIVLTSQPGQGSCFTVRLPLSGGRKMSRSLPSEIARSTVQVCMRRSLQRDVLIRRLGDLGCRVELSDCADEALGAVRTAEKSGRAVAFVFVDAAMRTLLDQPLYELLRDSGGARPPRTILLCHSQGQTLELARHEFRLQLPLTWDGLFEVMARSWRSLRVVPDLQAGPSMRGPVSQNADVVLVGQNVASRELSRLILARNGIGASVVDDLAALVATTGDERRPCLLIDCPYVPAVDLVRFLDGHRHRFSRICLLSAHPVSEPLAELNLPVLAKPLNEEIVSASIRPFADGGDRCREGSA